MCVGVGGGASCLSVVVVSPFPCCSSWAGGGCVVCGSHGVERHGGGVIVGFQIFRSSDC